MTADTKKILGGVAVFFLDGALGGVSSAAGLALASNEPINVRTILIIGLVNGITSLYRYIEGIKKRFLFEDTTTTTTAAGTVVEQKTTVDAPKLPVILLALLLAGLSACTSGGKPPVVVPPTPAPSPASMQLLRVVAGQFDPAILGSVTTHHGWPLVDAIAQDAIAGSGLNYTAMRLSCEIDDRPGYDMFVRVGDKVDLTRFNPAYDALLLATLEHAEDRKLYVNLGLWDGWCAVHIAELRSPFKVAGNVNGVDIGTCADFRQAPHPVIQAVVNHVVSVVGRLPNLVFELGNEANRCAPSPAFIDGIRAVIRTAEQANHYPRHLFSPGTWEGGELGSEYDFVSQHGNLVAVNGRAVEVNEFAPQDKATFLANLSKFRGLGPFHYWHDDPPARGTSWDDAAWEREWLDVMAAMKSAPPATGCTNIPNETAIAASPRPPADPGITAAINGALQRVTGCAVNSSCEIPEGMQPFFAKVTEEIRRGGLCAGVQTDSEGLVDQICVGSEKSCQGHHVYTCRPGCATGVVGWAPGSYSNRNGDTWVRP